MSDDRGISPSGVGLRGIALLQGLPASCLEALARECAWRRYAPGQPIVTCAEESRGVHLVVAGRVRVTTFSPEGRQVTFRDLRSGEHFGDIAAIDGMPRSADITAVEETLLASMTSGAFWRLLRTQPQVNERVLRRLATLVRALTERVMDLSTLGVKNRVHAEILRLAREAGIQDNSARIRPAPRHADLASQVSTYREQVTRELSALTRMGVLAKEPGTLVVRDVARLARLVETFRGGI